MIAEEGGQRRSRKSASVKSNETTKVRKSAFDPDVLAEARKARKSLHATDLMHSSALDENSTRPRRTCTSNVSTAPSSGAGETSRKSRQSRRKPPESLAERILRNMRNLLGGGGNSKFLKKGEAKQWEDRGDETSMALKAKYRKMSARLPPPPRSCNVATTGLYGPFCRFIRGSAVFSPIVTKMLCTLLLTGARRGTEKQLASLLSVFRWKEGQNQLVNNFASLVPEYTSENAGLVLWTHCWLQGVGTNERFRAFAEKQFLCSTSAMNFSANDTADAMSIMNLEVQGGTSQKVRSLFEPGDIGPGQQFVLASVLHCEPKWMTSFARTKGSFWRSEDVETSVEMLTVVGVFKTWTIPFLSCSACEIPFAHERFSMVVLLPSAGFFPSELKLQNAGFDISKSPRREEVSSIMSVTIPAFTVQTHMDMVFGMRQVGIRDLFQRGCNLSGISSLDNGRLRTSVVQKSVITVGHRGQYQPTEQVPTWSFVANQPFFFYVADAGTDGLVLFGRVMDPSNDGSFAPRGRKSDLAKE